MMRIFTILVTLTVSINTWAFSWKDLWFTPDQQGQQLMGKAHYAEAKETFVRADWAGSAAYRSGDYQKAVELFKTLKTEQGFYNQGNALAHMGQYEQAIEAYDEALKRNPNNYDALANRELVQELIKKDQEKKQNKEKQNKEKQNKEKQNKEKQNKEKQDNEKQDNEKQDNEKPNKEKQNKEKQDNQKPNKEKQNKAKQNQANAKKAEKKQTKNEALSEAEKEKQLAKEQWLRLIPEDPGGLMREKFLRDHLKRERGWYE